MEVTAQVGKAAFESSMVHCHKTQNFIPKETVLTGDLDTLTRYVQEEVPKHIRPGNSSQALPISEYCGNIIETQWKCEFSALTITSQVL